MYSFYLSERETALLLMALCCAQNNDNTTQADARAYKAIFQTIVDQHDRQPDPKEVQ